MLYFVCSQGLFEISLIVSTTNKKIYTKCLNIVNIGNRLQLHNALQFEVCLWPGAYIYRDIY